MRLSPNFSTNTSLVKITSDFLFAKFKGQFLVLILFKGRKTELLNPSFKLFIWPLVCKGDKALLSAMKYRCSCAVSGEAMRRAKTLNCFRIQV